MWYHMYGFSPWWSWIDAGVSILFWGSILLVVAWLVKNHKFGHMHCDSPVGILKRRLANGEISVEEFERLRKTLES